MRREERGWRGRDGGCLCLSSESVWRGQANLLLPNRSLALLGWVDGPSLGHTRWAFMPLLRVPQRTGPERLSFREENGWLMGKDTADGRELKPAALSIKMI